MTWYSTGTVTTSANNAVVTGTGTEWTNSGLRPGDMLLIGYSRGFEIKSIDSATQITLILPFPVAVSGEVYTGIPMLGGDRTVITMALANQVSKALTDTEAMSAVYQTFYTSPGTVNLKLPGGLMVTGSSFQKLTADMASKADITALDGKANKGDVYSKSETLASTYNDTRLATTSWVSPSPVNGWVVNAGAGGRTAYRKMNGLVYIEVNLANGNQASGTFLFSIPPDLAPGGNRFAVSVGLPLNPTVLFIDTAGVVRLASPAQGPGIIANFCYTPKD